MDSNNNMNDSVDNSVNDGIDNNVDEVIEENVAEFDKAELLGLPEDLTEPEVRLDLETPLEYAFIIAGIIGIIVTIAQIVDSADRNPGYIALSILFTIFAFYIRTQIDCTYIIDNMKRVLLYRRTIFGSISETHICNLCDIYSVAVQGKFVKTKNSSYCHYWVILILKSGEVIDVSNGSRDDSGFNVWKSFANKLAEHFEVPFFESDCGNGVKVTPNQYGGKLTVDSFELKQAPVSLAWILLVVLIIIMGIGISFYMMSFGR